MADLSGRQTPEARQASREPSPSLLSTSARKLATQDTQADDMAEGSTAGNDDQDPMGASLTQESSRDRAEADDKEVKTEDDKGAASSATAGSSRRNANGTVGSVYSGNKIRHLKKEDGIPLWRKDIQHSFLRAVFEDETRCFTLDEGGGGHTFADIYINAMARSTKTSKILREKLLLERESALNMAMICLLVNVGRMNTTLNFFPEMRAQLRTYHSIPCLQVNQSHESSQYKGLQDAPRLKSILKGSCEDPEQPTTLEKIQAAKIPRTNPVSLIFVLAQFAPKISETHFKHPRDFFDLVIRGTLSSKSRARAFLWLIWWYLESDFTAEAALNNPFGPGSADKDEPGSLPFKVPEFDFLTEEQASAENVDTEEEQAYGEKMRLVRKRILEEDETVGPPMKKPSRFDEKARSSPARSDINRTRSPTPETIAPVSLPRPKSMAKDDGTPKSDVETRQPRIKFRPSKMERSMASSSPAPAPANAQGPHIRRARPETSHQRAVNLNRKMRIESILYKRLVKVQGERRRAKRQARVNKPFVAMKRILTLPEDYDSETEEAWGPGGLIPHKDELEDFGSEALDRRKVIDRAVRRLAREETARNPTSSLGEELQTFLRDDKVEITPPNEAPRRRKPGSREKMGAQKAKRAQAAKEQGEKDDDIDMMGGGGVGGDDSGDDSAGDESDTEADSELGMDEGVVEW